MRSAALDTCGPPGGSARSGRRSISVPAGFLLQPIDPAEVAMSGTRPTGSPSASSTSLMSLKRLLETGAQADHYIEGL